MIIEQPMGYGVCKKNVSVNGQIISWVCHKKGCKGRLKTSADYRNVGDKEKIIPIKIVNNHTCVPNVNLFNERLIDRESKREGQRDPFAGASNIVNTQCDKVLADDAPQEFIPSVKNAARRVRRQRRQPPLPKTVEDSPSFLFSEEAIEEGFYRFDVTVQEKGKTLRHFAFMKNKQIKYLVKAKEIKIDSTFKVVKKPFYQLMSIQSIVNVGFKRKTYPLGYVLMSGKREADYVAVFERLKAYLQHSDQQLNV